MQYAICNHYHFVHGDILVLFHEAFACYHSFFGCMVLAKFTNVLLNSPTSLSTSPKKITYKNSVCHLPFAIYYLQFTIQPAWNILCAIGWIYSSLAIFLLYFERKKRQKQLPENLSNYIRLLIHLAVVFCAHCISPLNHF